MLTFGVLCACVLAVAGFLYSQHPEIHASVVRWLFVTFYVSYFIVSMLALRIGRAMRVRELSLQLFVLVAFLIPLPFGAYFAYLHYQSRPAPVPPK
jgi:hypothetical protein